MIFFIKGYSEASGLPKLYTTIVAGCTYEGENMVMLQQAARFVSKFCEFKKGVHNCRYLMKCHKHAVRGEPLSYSVEFLGKRGESRSRIGMNEGNFEKEIEVEIFIVKL